MTLCQTSRRLLCWPPALSTATFFFFASSECEPRAMAPRSFKLIWQTAVVWENFWDVHIYVECYMCRRCVRHASEAFCRRRGVFRPSPSDTARLKLDADPQRHFPSQALMVSQSLIRAFGFLRQPMNHHHKKYRHAALVGLHTPGTPAVRPLSAHTLWFPFALQAKPKTRPPSLPTLNGKTRWGGAPACGGQSPFQQTVGRAVTICQSLCEIWMLPGSIL